MKNSYQPIEPMWHCAMEAERFVQQGLVKDSGVKVIFKDYTHKIARNEEISIEDVRDIFLYLMKNHKSRQFGWELPENLSNERIMWQAQGGCGAYEWSHKILQDALDAEEIDKEFLGPDYLTPEEFFRSGYHY